MGERCRATALDWDAFRTVDGARKACAAAGILEDAWWPDLILAADVYASARSPTHAHPRTRTHACAPTHAHPRMRTHAWPEPVSLMHDPLVTHARRPSRSCYNEQMGDALLATLGHLLRAAPRTARAVVLNGWPNRGLARFEQRIGARQRLAEQEARALAHGECVATTRPYLHAEASEDSPDCDPPCSRADIELLQANRITGFADHAHHVYVLGAR